MSTVHVDEGNRHPSQPLMGVIRALRAYDRLEEHQDRCLSCDDAWCPDAMRLFAEATRLRRVALPRRPWSNQQLGLTPDGYSRAEENEDWG